MVRRLRIARRTSAGSDFEDLIGPHFDRLYSRAFVLTGNAADAEDLVQELCIRVYQRQDEVAGLDKPVFWMMRVLYRLFVDLVRSRDRSPIRLMTSNEAYELLAESTASSEPGPERRAEAAIADEKLQLAWQRLKKEEQLLLTLHGIEGLSLAEIQEITELPIGTIKSRLHRSRVKLGRLLEGAGDRGLVTLRGDNDEMPRRRKSVG